MKIKVRTPGNAVVGLSRRELLIINNCLNEACNGLLMDRFIPVHDELSSMLDNVREIMNAEDAFKVRTASV